MVFVFVLKWGILGRANLTICFIAHSIVRYSWTAELVQLTSSHCIFIAHWAIAGFGRSCLIISSLFHYRRFWVECIICILFNQVQFSLISLETNKQIIKKSQQLLSNKSNRVPANRQLHKGKLYVNITQSEHLKYRKQSVQLLKH